MTSPLLICATNRLAQTLRSALPGNGATVWETPRAFAFEAWLDQLGDEAMLSGVLPPQILLDAYCERMLWQRVITDSIGLDEEPLFDTAAMARKAADAHATSITWELSAGLDGVSREAALFEQWRADFRQTLDRNGWTVAADRRESVVCAIEQGRLRVHDDVVFAGFDELTPLQRRLFAALDARVQPASMGAAPGCMPAVTTYEDVGAECHAAARWASAQLEIDPCCQVGIVVPDLGKVRERLEAELEKALHPELATPAYAEHPRRYNFSLGSALSEVPIVACALQLLRFAHDLKQVEQSALSSLLLNPYWSDSMHEADARGVLDAQMRRRFRRRVDVAEVTRLAHTLDSQGRVCCPAAVRHLSGLVRYAAECEGEPRLPSGWAGAIRTLLFKAGWAGSAARECRTLSSHEYQARETWSELLDCFARTDSIVGAQSFGQALAHLQALCRERLFQPQTRGAPPVQVIGMLESTGLKFDALWVMGMHGGAWPPAPSPNPLIPVELQRTHGIPGSCATVQLAHARTVLRRLQHQAPLVRFSCPLMDGAQELHHSPLFDRAEGHAVATSAEPCPLPVHDHLECLDDANGPPVGENERPRGGVSLLRAQAICPAWAFYRYRLGAAALERPQHGLGAQERGTLVHDALEWFWRQVGSHRALAELSGRPEALAAQVATAIGTSLAGYEARVEPMLPGLRELETQRMTLLLHEWLALERQRADFVVVECEREVKHTIGPVALTLRIDRIDRQGDKLVVIDYKTGVAASINNWAAARITEPQLPLYALALAGVPADGPVSALVFGKVRPGASRFAGLSDTEEVVPGVKGMHKVHGRPFAAFPDWAALQGHWSKSLAAVADEFARGVASVSFDDRAALDHCEVLPLLRLPEQAAMRAGLSAFQAQQGH